MFEFLLTHNGTDNPTFITVIITVLCSFFLSSLIVLTYELTTKSIHRPLHFMQSMALISIVAATVMQAIGDSLARGLGMLGALAIIRFRTNLDDPRNMTFMFAAIATGIACGVFGFTTAFIGTIGFCLAAIILRFSPFGKTDDLLGKLRIDVPKDSATVNEVQAILTKHCSKVEVDEVKFLNLKKKQKIRDAAGNVVEERQLDLEELIEYNFLIRMKSGGDERVAQFTKDLEQLDDIRELRLRFNPDNIKL
ncbi:MAG: DUF4956 domain-containing protein [Saprospiraceae bacterium]